MTASASRPQLEFTPGLVSVVIPTYNAAAFIRETLACVAAQSYPSIELIVADNGSTDATVELVRSSGVPARLLHIADRGPGPARNGGLDAARGEFVQFLDGDDLLEPDKIARQVATLRATGADVVWAPFWNYEAGPDGAYRKTTRTEPQLGEDVAASLLTAEGFVQLGSLLIRRTPAMRAVRFATTHPHVEDVKYAVDLADAGLRFVRGEGDSGLLFRQHGIPRVSSRPSKEFGMACFNTSRSIESDWRAMGALTPSRIGVLTDSYLFSLRTLHGLWPEQFREIHAHLTRLNPRYIERLPARLRLPARVVGYRGAERLARAYRTLMTLVRGRATQTGLTS